MAPTLNSASGLSILSTNIVTSGVDRDVVSGPQAPVVLFFTLAVDLNQFTWNPSFAFTADFQVENYYTGQKTNRFWIASLNALPQAPFLWLSLGGAASAFGVSTPGIYLYRPTFIVTAPNLRELPPFIGDSGFAVAEEHFFILEGT
jgi:hypothetical protein